MKKSLLLYIASAVLFIILFLSYLQYRKTHTFTITDYESQQIQPVFTTVRVSGTQDTDVWFIDSENKDIKYHIGYITPGMSETIKLKKGRWYSVQASGEITVYMVNIRIE